MAQSLTLALVVPLGAAQVAQAAGPAGLGRPDVPSSRASKVKPFDAPGAKKARQKVAEDKKANAAQARRARSERTNAWPKQGEATVALTDGTAPESAPGGLPVTVTRPSGKAALPGGDVHLTVLDQKAAQEAGITGVLLTAEAERAGSARVRVDYSRFASAVGGGWAQRLRLVELPACALTTPQKEECRKQRPLTSANDAARQTVSADVRLPQSPTGVSAQLMRTATASSSGATVLALTATSAGSGQSPNGAGDYSATELSESSAWSAGGNSGSFTWSYGFTLPPAAAGPVPTMTLSYDSGSVDGRTATTNNQGTSVGEGFTLSDSYVERSYGSCDDDGHADVFDQCWKYDNATLVLNGRSTSLVKDDSTGVWHLQDDDASKVTHSTGADNGDDNGEYWTVVTGDGTKYVFGLNKLAGADTQRTNSVWTAPVFGDDSGEPGYSGGSSFADRSLTQAWRWNLDYVEDLRGNAATYWYTKETNYYKKNKATTANTVYTRSGYLNRVEYGLRKGALFTDKPDAKVTFGYAERCTASDCSSLTKDTADDWPDVPFDAICSSGDTDCNATSPSFFTRKRLTGVNTYSYNAGTATYDPVDSWSLAQEYLDGNDIGDSSDQVLTLKSLTRTGKAGAASITLNPISFTYQMRPNRVDATDDILPLTRPRISTITSETGAITSVNLSPPECVRSELSGAAEDTNTRSCYPQYWHINGAAEASIDWFHKYRVLGVTVSDPAANNPAVEHAYSYTGAAWHFSDNPFTPKDERTWSDWRGYQKVTAYTGATSVTRSKTVSLYLQGMDGDKKKDGTTKAVTVAPLLDTDVDFPIATDSDRYKGMLRQQITYNGSQPIGSVFNNYAYRQTASQAVPDAATQVAQWVRGTTTYRSTYLTASANWRTHETQAHYDDLGMVTSSDDYGQRGLGGDESCTRTWYARNAALGITNLVSRTRTVARSCSTSDTSLSLPTNTATRGDVLSDTATVYDEAGATGWSAVQQPTKGEPTWTGRATGYASTADSNGDRLPTDWQTLATTTYDGLGRPLAVTDTAGHTTATSYSPADAGPLTRTINTDPKGFRTASFLDPRRGLPLRTYDLNLKKTEQSYDALGRATGVWLPNRNAGTQSPNKKFAYHLDNTSASWVSTSTLTNGETYNTSYALYDALLRPLQTQTPTPQGGRLLTDKRYDTRGLVYRTYADIFDTTSTPNGTYARSSFGSAPQLTETVYDGAGRPTTSSLYIYGTEKWSTTTTYTGDSTATTALEGGSAQRTITDIRGRTTETRSYAGTNPADADFGTGPGTPHTSTTFSYAVDGKQKSIAGPDGATTWSYTYDLFGRQTTAVDPDKGTTTSEYNSLDQVIKSTDARGSAILTAYDELGRTTGTWAGSKTDANQLTAFTYDTVFKGLPASSTRYVGGKTGAAYTHSVTSYDALSRPTATQLQLPDSEPFVSAGESSTLAYETHYNTDGTVQYTSEPALGGLQAETNNFRYDGLGNLTEIPGYLKGVTYSALTQPQLLALGVDNNDSYVYNEFEPGTGRLTQSRVSDDTHAYKLQELHYSYDQTGNVTAIADTTTAGGASSPDTQCFAYDGYQRLAEAWTPASQDCTDTRSSSGLSGPAPYWTSYTYTSAGQRTTETAHSSSGDTTTTYCYTNSSQPHTLTGTTTKADCTTPEHNYGYDATGNTTQRPGPAGTQTLTWSPEGKLANLTESSNTTDYLYDADGSLLIRTTENGERVLYAGTAELHLRTDGTTWAQRRYATGGTTVAMRSNESGTTKTTFLIGDHHSTATLAINTDAAQTYTKRYTTPFGADRGTPLYGPWPDDKGFLGKTRDVTTGLTHIGAREYDPGIGQFISVDPLLESDKAQTLNGYSYAAQNPLTDSDPTGMGLACGGHGDSAAGCPQRPDGSQGNGRPNEGVAPGTGCVAPCGTVSTDSSGTAKDDSDCGWLSICGLGNAWDATTDWLSDHSTIAQVVTETVVGVACYGSAASAGFATGGAGFYAATGCSAVVGAAGAAVKNALSDDADHSLPGQLKDQGVAAVWSAASGAVEYLALAKMAGILAKCHSFLPGTGVLMGDGTEKAIEEVVVGDVVVTTDSVTGVTTKKTVVQTIATEDDKDFTEISIAPGGKKSSIVATDTHPFWVPDLKKWIKAGDLEVGQMLRTNAGTYVQITAVRHYAKRQRTHDLTIDDIHAYYVLAGATPVLVHNCGGAPTHVTGKGDDPLVPELINDINARYPGHVRAEGVTINGPDGSALTDFDIVTRNAVVQVKSGSGKGALKQALNTQSLTDYPVIVYLPQGRGSVIKSLEQAGIMVTRDKNLLLDVLAP
nr:polymorphic toxin-type HINT domain-containing protein [Streptomyces actuosus]